MGKLYNYMNESLKQMKSEANDLKKQLQTLPDGNLLLRKKSSPDGNVKKGYCYNYYDERNIRKQRTIKNDEDILFNSLVKKRLIKRALPIYANNIEALEKCISKYIDLNLYSIKENIPNIADTFCEMLIPPHKYQSDMIRSYNIDNQLWDELDVYSNKFHDEMISIGDINDKNADNVFRSKSEYIIASLLKEYNISYKYEPTLRLPERTVYPDFALRRPADGRVIFWEHFGLINNNDYREKMYMKLSEYSQSGITLWNNLITTFDLPEGGIDTSLIRKIINVFILQ